MGINCLGSNWDDENSNVSTKRRKGLTKQHEPKPKVFDIKKSYGYNGWCVIFVNYQNCLNYDGDKICVYNKPLSRINAERLLDPHFCLTGIAPFARFEPTHKGYEMAIKFIMNCVN